MCDHYNRKAESKQRQAGFQPIVRKLDKLLTELEGKLTRANLALHQQHWVMFTVLGAYLCRRQCFEVMCDQHRLPQVRIPARPMCPSQQRFCCLVSCIMAWVRALASFLCFIFVRCTGVQACTHPCICFLPLHSELFHPHLHTRL